VTRSLLLATFGTNHSQKHWWRRPWAGLTQALAVEFGAKGIRVNAILAGGTDRPMGREVASTPESLAFVQGLHALKRLATPAEQAKSVLYLASDASSFTTGTALLVDGGVSLNRI